MTASFDPSEICLPGECPSRTLVSRLEASNLLIISIESLNVRETRWCVARQAKLLAGARGMMTKVKARRTAATMRKRGKGYFPYSTIILLLKRIRDNSYVPYNTVILLLKAQEIVVSDTLHTYISFISSYKRPMPAVFQLQNNMNKSSEQNRTEHIFI